MPSAQSIGITGITPQYCQDHGLVEADFARAIHKEMIRENTISVGYNSMRFDDEVSRFTFWRNFISPYDREFDNGCSRFDLFPLVVATWALRPDGINWPLSEQGNRPSFRLEHLSAANGLTHEHAHDALSDVQATIEMAKLIRRQQPRLWEYALRLRFKQEIKRIVESEKALLWVCPMHGVEHGYMRVVRVLGRMPGKDPNKVLVWDLSEDPSELLTINAQEVRARTFVKEEDLPEEKTRLPIFTLKINQAPFIVNHLGVLSDKRAGDFGIDKALIAKHDAILEPHINTFMGLWAEAFEEEQVEEDSAKSDPDEGLYKGGFPSYSDKKLISLVSRLTPQALGQWVHDGKLTFEDARFNELLFRFRARNWPETLTPQEQSRWLEFRRARLMDGVGKARTLQSFAEEVEALAESYGEEIDERAEELCGALYDWMEVVSNSLDPVEQA